MYNNAFVLLGEYGVAVGIFNMASNWLRASPWRLLLVVCVVGFLAGGLLDLDHIPAALGLRIGYVPFEMVGWNGVHGGRLLHGVALVGGGAMCACAGGYLLFMVLKELVNKAIVQLKTIPQSMENKIHELLEAIV